MPTMHLRLTLTLLAAVTALPGTSSALRASAAPPVRYLLLAGTVLTIAPEDTGQPGESIRLAGGFQLTPQFGPLDWDVFAVDDFKARRRSADDPSVVLRGQGTYVRGGRFTSEERLRIEASGAGWTCNLDSGPLPLGAGEPLAAIDLKGSTLRDGTPCTVSLHLESAPELQRWRYRLLPDSQFLDDCIICDRPSIPWPMSGSFDLVLTAETPIGNRYRIVNVEFEAGNGSDLVYRLTGEGEYELGGEVAIRQSLALTLEVTAPSGTRIAPFTELNPAPGRRWPMFHVDADETTGSDLSTYRLQLRAAPLRELWFTTAHGMTPGNSNAVLGHIAPGDILADTGRRVRANADLLEPFGWKPGFEDTDVHSLTAGPGGQLWFSLDDVTAPDGQRIGWGDLLADTGATIATVPELLAAFGLMPPVPDAGLDAFAVAADGARLFSLRRDVFSEGLGQTLHHGDILSDRGTVVRRFKDLVASFEPQDLDPDAGLDAFHVWPSGEIWFSTSAGFVSGTRGPIQHGDLLSEDGYVVCRNLDLVRPFSPLEDLADFGLDDIMIVTDTTPPPKPPAQLMPAPSLAGDGAWALRWVGAGRVYQVEQATDAAGFFVPAGPLQTGQSFTVPAAPGDAPRFFRVAAW